MGKPLTAQDVQKHNTENDCWIIVHGKVYDLSNFLSEHPGGKKVLVRVAGTDASKQFDNFHNKAVLDQWGPKLLVGSIGEASASSNEVNASSTEENPEYFGELIPFGDPSWYYAPSPYYNDSHKRLRAALRKFVDSEIMPFTHEWDEAKKIPQELFIKLAKAGILSAVVGHPYPTAYAYTKNLIGDVTPEEFDPFHEFIICDEISRCGSGGVLWGLVGGLGIGLPPILNFGSEELKQKVAPGCLSGEKFICLAVTEPYAGSDVANIRCEAKLSDDGEHYVVNGEKKWITNGVWADYFTVAVRTGGEGMGGVSLLLIERSMPGVKTRQMQCSGVWCSGTSYITFEDVKVPRSNLVGKENKGFKYIMYNFNHERMGIAIQASRFSRVCLEESIKYANKRKTFGKKLIDHPVIRDKCARMAGKIEAVHAWMESLINMTKVMPKDMQMVALGGPIALLKAQSTQTFEFCAREAAQIFGGLSYTRGGQGEKVERLYREVRAYAIPAGSEEIMLDLGIRQSLKLAKMFGAKM
ncbi:acyl-CoA dehydrogenase NM domain-like protein [Basidiobolus meristosporus CBS 931.73]|uniref:Acyl-CoA dehydrogenase NM domain-like protein n=1 Tax=Basidiobolus meristosporus CBS 931.73 TaxID=1314790 RepID=A0A1Y1WWK6_9FUNG|nr:acyl-CoA dehydrogenase NM domain-like protein [Basidiobolus meristosporus CBS 931.73]|eukprot:ORX77514.1 acyl-CoA dehydrogenase NM domain-like protein [Basidiobolus meristosporus CBS 931.73]